MNKLVLLSAFGVLILLSSLINGMAGNETINCSQNISISYYYSPTCSACVYTTPIIDNLINNGCGIVKINIKENYELAINNNVQYTPTLIVGDKRIVGKFTISQVKDLIDS